MPISEVGAMPSGEGPAGSGVEVVLLRTGPTQIDPRAQGVPVATLVISVKDQTGQETFFKLNKTTKMEKVFHAFAARKSLPAASLCFLLDGLRLLSSDTPATLRLRDQDRIDCVLEQPWTGPWTSFTRACLVPGYEGTAPQQAPANREINEQGSRARATPAGREGQPHVEMCREALEALQGVFKISECVTNQLEALEKRTVELEQAQSRLERRTLLVIVVGFVTLWLWFAP